MAAMAQPVRALQGSMVTPPGREAQDGTCEMSFEESADGSLTIHIGEGTVYFDSYDTLERLIAQYKAAIVAQVPEAAEVPVQTIVASVFSLDLQRADEGFHSFARSRGARR